MKRVEYSSRPSRATSFTTIYLTNKALAAQFKAHDVDRIYQAIVHGAITAGTQMLWGRDLT